MFTQSFINLLPQKFIAENSVGATSFGTLNLYFIVVVLESNPISETSSSEKLTVCLTKTL